MAREPLPVGWSLRPLQDICLGGGQYGANVPKRDFNPGLPRYVRITDISSNGRLIKADPASISETDAADYILKDGDLLLARSGATVGKSYLHDAANGRCAYAGYLIRFRPNPNCIEPAFLKQFFHSSEYWSWVRDTQRALAQPNINASEYGALAIPTPPFPEQQKIAAILSSVDDTIERTEAVIDQLEVIKKGLLAELLTRGMPGRHKEFRETEIGQIPASWDLKPAVQLCERIVVGIVVQPAKYYVPSGIPCLRSQNVRTDRIELHNLVYLSPESNRLHAKSMIRAGDVLTVRTGYPGTSAPAPPELDGANCVDLIISTTKPSVLRGAFLSRFMNSDVGMGQIAIGQTGLAQQHFNIGTMKLLLVPVPLMEEQDAILEHLTAFDTSLTANRAVLASLRKTKDALVDSLLSGRIRVSTPTGEAA